MSDLGVQLLMSCELINFMHVYVLSSLGTLAWNRLKLSKGVENVSAYFFILNLLFIPVRRE